MTIKELAGYSQKLTGKLESDAISLPLDTTSLLAALPEVGDYTYLTLDDGVSMEVVKVYNDANEILIERGQGGTSSSSFPIGTCMKFRITGVWIEDFVCSMPAECKPKPITNECSNCNGCCD